MIDVDGTDHKAEFAYSHKFDSQMASYLYGFILNGDDGDDGDSNPDWGESWNRYGKRVLSVDAQGFVSVDTFDSVTEAAAYCEAIREGI